MIYIYVYIYIYTLLTSSVLLAQVRESPYIPKPHAVTDNTEEKLHLPAPFRPVLLLGLLTASSILIPGYHDCHVLPCLTFLVQRSQLMPISRILVLDYHASLRTSLFPKAKRRVSLSLSFSPSLFCLFGEGGGGRIRRSNRVFFLFDI